MDPHYVPLSVRSGARPPLPLVDEIPDRAVPLALGWLERASHELGIPWGHFVLATDFPAGLAKSGDLWYAVSQACRYDSECLLDALDFALQHHGHYGVLELPRLARDLEQLLALANVNWSVPDRAPYRLTRRVLPETLREYQAALEATDDRTGALLREAWAHGFQRDGDPQTAWRKAVAAVESGAGADRVPEEHPSDVVLVHPGP